ncbi:hypothetical protein [Myxosarcina sp. GI1]|uniref:hypothetical protein n=1 Tax=Myxosarcina sp. GI1 TaxID=1541065 RepID=UPI00068E56C9|nr:hypothetical protein [Myxosarcina sp. GI1]
MKQSIKPRQLRTPKLNFLEWNPQLFREVKGKFKPRNIIVTVSVSLVTQIAFLIYFLGKLPEPLSTGSQYSRYCFGTDSYLSESLCQTDLLDNWLINWQLLWFDLFVLLSLVAIFALLIIGTYMLVADIVKEESSGTLNFIRLTPQSATSILTGKLVGVPSLLYLGILLAFPLHLYAGLGARLSLNLVLGFDAAIVAACAFFYSAALLWSLVNTGLSGFKPWLFGGVVTFFVCTANQAAMSNYSTVFNNSLDWFNLFYPGRILTYLSDATYLPSIYLSYSNAEDFRELLFYGHSLWTTPSLGIGLTILNLGLWTYWIWEALKRRFHNPEYTLLSKTQSYWITGWFVAICLGFTLQSTETHQIMSNLSLLQFFLLVFFLGLIAALSPHRQTLQDWARYRHQLERKGIWQELIFGDRSPATVAIAINLLMVTAYILPSVLLFPVEENTATTVWGLIIGANIILFYSLVAQLVLTIASQKRAIWAAATVLALIVVPVVSFGLIGFHPELFPQGWLFSFLPLLGTKTATLSMVLSSILVQWLAIALAGFQMTKVIRQAGASETKLLLGK